MGFTPSSRNEKLYVLCGAAQDVMVELPNRDDLYHTLWTALEEGNIAAINAVLFQGTGKKWRMLSHWFRSQYGDFVLRAAASDFTHLKSLEAEHAV